MDPLPDYADLLLRSDAPPGSTWGLFGPGESGDVGTLGLLDRLSSLRGIEAVRTGDTFSLNYPMDAFAPPLLPSRPAPLLEITSRHAEHREDLLHRFNPQSSSQIDGLRHRKHQTYGFYNFVGDDEIAATTTRLGIQGWAASAIVGRAVVVDLSHPELEPIDHLTATPLEIDHIEKALAHQQVSVEDGDILLVHTGWCEWYLKVADDESREKVRRERRFTGFAQRRSFIEWLWDHRIPLIGTDTFAVECFPSVPDSDFSSENDGGLMHQELLALMGYALGELWHLDGVASACRRENRWTCLLVSAPLNVPGGASTTANAVAII